MNDQNQKDNDAEVTALDSLMPSSTPSDLGEIVDSVKREPSASAEIQAENERLREALADKEEDLRGQHNGTPWDVFKMLTDWAAWSDSVWGEGRSPAGAINHLAQEVDELRSSPQNIMEHVDVIMLAMESLRLAGFDVAELVDAAAKKLEINKQREWGPVDDDGVSQHVGDPSC